MITQLENIRSINPIQGTERTENTQQTYYPGDSLFATVFESAIQNVKDTDAEKVHNQYLLSTGQLDNPASLMIAMSKNQIAVDLLIQLRNRALDAYSELTRINL